MGLLDKAKSAAEAAAAKAREGVEDVQEKRERAHLVTQLGNEALDLIKRGELDHPTLKATAAKIQQLDAQEDTPSGAAPPGP